MSQEAVMEIIVRAGKEDGFRQQLFTDPQTALEGYDLTAEERTMLENLDDENFDDFAGNLGGRDTKGFVLGTR
jgi:hypothetical protein